MKRWCLILLGIWLLSGEPDIGLCDPTGGASPDNAKIIRGYNLAPAQYRQLKTMLETACAPDGHVSYISATRRLLVYASASAHRKIERIITEAAGPRVNIRLQVDFLQADYLHRHGFRFGMTISDHRISGNLRLKNQRTIQERNASMTLLTTNGNPAMLWDVRIEPDLTVLSYYHYIPLELVQAGGQVTIHNYSQPDFRTVQLGCTLWVMPELMSNDLLRIRLLPSIRTKKSGKDIYYCVKELQTTVYARHGQKIFLGSVNRSFRQFFQNVLGLSRSEHADAKLLSVYLTPFVEKVGQADRGVRSVDYPIKEKGN
ncbi:MAG: hypothetical protein D6820_07850 [Lentisphaerae bacterium]|nr:MAG: hypothetical protein D6820_07850 [Lentisphaerota bacterium]